MIIDISEDGYTIEWTSLVTGERKTASVVQLIEAFESIVRCKDCKWYQEENYFCEYWASLYKRTFQPENCPRTAPFEYCSRGVRKDEAEE